MQGKKKFMQGGIVNLLPVNMVNGQEGVRLASGLASYAAVGRAVSSCQVWNRCCISWQ